MTIELERRDHVLLMGVRRPEKMNALSRDMYRSLARAFHQLEHDPDLWVGVIWAEGPHFTSGVDLNDWAAARLGAPSPATAEAMPVSAAISLSRAIARLRSSGWAKGWSRALRVGWRRA